jgi:hypothetical protein
MSGASTADALICAVIDGANRAASRKNIARPRRRSASGCRIAIEERSVRRSSALLVTACVVALSGCAIRYDNAGVSRVGIGLWGFGDPPGVNWNLDWPRREVPDLPPMGPREWPDPPRSFHAPVGGGLGPTTRDNGAGRDVVIDDNRCRAAHSNAIAQFAPLSPSADPHRSSALRS